MSCRLKGSHPSGWRSTRNAERMMGFGVVDGRWFFFPIGSLSFWMGRFFWPCFFFWRRGDPDISIVSSRLWWIYTTCLGSISCVPCAPQKNIPAVPPWGYQGDCYGSIRWLLRAELQSWLKSHLLQPHLQVGYAGLGCWKEPVGMKMLGPCCCCCCCCWWRWMIYQTFDVCCILSLTPLFLSLVEGDSGSFLQAPFTGASPSNASRSFQEELQSRHFAAPLWRVFFCVWYLPWARREKKI